MSSEQCEFFEESIIDPPENSVSSCEMVLTSSRCDKASALTVCKFGSWPQVLTTGTELQGPAPAQRYLLSINLKQGKNLIIRDKRSGRSKPSQVCVAKATQKCPDKNKSRFGGFVF